MIKNLLFDLGGVIMNFEKQHCIDAFIEMGLPNAADFFGDFGQKGPFALIEEGKITPDEFHSQIRQLIPHPVSDEQIDHAFILFLVGIPAERLDFLDNLHSRYRLFLLSNTNPIMWNTFIASEFRKTGHDINYYFDGIVTSFQAKALKPEPEIFRFAIDRFAIDPEETIFFDDSQKNLSASEAFGFQTCLVPEDGDIRDIIPVILS